MVSQRSDHPVGMKIAAITDDGVTISQHFGRAPYYAVLTVENGEIVKREMRDKLGHAHFAKEEHRYASGRHGFGPGAKDRHARMAAAIADCQVFLYRGMGWDAYEGMKETGITPMVTDSGDIEAAVQAYLDGTISDAFSDVGYLFRPPVSLRSPSDGF